MHTYRFIVLLLIMGFFIGVLATGLAADDGKSQALNQVLKEIQATEQLIRRKAELAENMRLGLLQQVDDLKAEINQERRHAPVTAFPQALQIARIDYDLRLIQRLCGYIELLKDRIGYFHSTVHTLDFYRRQIHDDMLFLRTLNGVDTDNLMRQLGDDLNSFNSQTEKPLIATSNSGLRLLDTIWNDILQGK
jgi:hypothetical protein